MKTVEDILEGVEVEAIEGDLSRVIAGIHFDSRQIEQGDFFVAIRGSVTDGHRYIDQAEKNGARTILCEEFPENKVLTNTYVKVTNSKKALAKIAANKYDSPSADMTLIGVTGTNGKTTVSSLLYQMFVALGYKAGLISTVNIKIAGEEFENPLTTPDSLTINSCLAEMRDRGVDCVFMEVSSHGIDQERTTALQFDGGIFTNLSHEHLDYHKTFKAYRDVKKRFFDELPKDAFALTNADDKNGTYMLQNTKAEKHSYALKSDAAYKARIQENELTGLKMRINDNEVWSQLIGEFNAYNLLAIYAATDLMGVPAFENLKAISQLKPVAGRFQYFISEKDGITVVVDYAHSPDALSNVLQTLNAVQKKNQSIFTVVGCGGDRDTTKRPEMASIAGELSSKVILTSDNPRTEDPEAIIRDMEKGLDAEQLKNTTANSSRYQAIKTACAMAAENDLILIAGKGHEIYQEINGRQNEFDDLKVARELMKELDK